MTDLAEVLSEAFTMRNQWDMTVGKLKNLPSGRTKLKGGNHVGPGRTVTAFRRMCCWCKEMFPALKLNAKTCSASCRQMKHAKAKRQQ